MTQESIVQAEGIIETKGKETPRVLPAYLALIAGIVCIAWSAIFVRWTNIPGPASAFYRMLVPAVILLPTAIFDRNSTALSRRMLWIIALGGVFFALDPALYNTAILKTSAANATLLGNNTPIAVGLISWLVFRKKPGSAFWWGLLLAVGGQPGTGGGRFRAAGSIRSGRRNGARSRRVFCGLPAGHGAREEFDRDAGILEAGDGFE
jgi:uncharacterized membrane protein